MRVANATFIRAHKRLVATTIVLVLGAAAFTIPLGASAAPKTVTYRSRIKAGASAQSFTVNSGAGTLTAKVESPAKILGVRIKRGSTVLAKTETFTLSNEVKHRHVYQLNTTVTQGTYNVEVYLTKAIKTGSRSFTITITSPDPSVTATTIRATTTTTRATSTTARPTSTTMRATTTTKAPTTTTRPQTTTTVAPPVLTDFPNANNTGVPSGTSLTKTSGMIMTTRDGQVIENMEIDGMIHVVNNNVIIRKVRVRSSGTAIIQETNKNGMVIEDSELISTDTSLQNPSTAVTTAFYTIRRTEITGFASGLLGNGATVAENNYIHNFGNYASKGTKQYGIVQQSGDIGTYRHNTVLMNIANGNNAAIYVAPENHHHGIVIDNNLVAGGDYVIGCGGASNNFSLEVTNNHISTTFFANGGRVGTFGSTSGVKITGNIWQDGVNAGKTAS